MADAEDDRTTSSLSWIVQVQRYIQSQPTTDSELLARRKQLLDTLQQSPTCAEPWARFLENEERIFSQTGVSTSGIGLGHLYNRATELVPRTRGVAIEPYMRLWVGHARCLWQKNADEGRDLFKALKNQHIGNACALLYCEWARLEARTSNGPKAIAVLQKGLKECAEPRSMLEAAMANLQAAGVDTASADVPLRRVHFQDGGDVDDAMDGRRVLCPGTPGMSASACSNAPMATLSQASSSSKSSLSHLQSDLSMGLLCSLPTISKSQVTSHTQSSEEDTISCRAGEDKTQASLRVGASGSNSNNTGTVTLPNGMAGTLNIAAGAAAIAALTGGAGGSTQAAHGSGGGNNTGNMSLGLKRFGLKSKAVRVTPSDQQPAPEEAGAGQEAKAAATSASSLAATTPAALPTASVQMHSADRRQPSLMEGAAAVVDAEACPMDIDGVLPASQGSDDAQRKRKPDAMVNQSPQRTAPADLQQGLGPKRRQSPDISELRCEEGAAATPIVLLPPKQHQEALIRQPMRDLAAVGPSMLASCTDGTPAPASGGLGASHQASTAAFGAPRDSLHQRRPSHGMVAMATTSGGVGMSPPALDPENVPPLPSASGRSPMPPVDENMGPPGPVPMDENVAPSAAAHRAPGAAAAVCMDPGKPVQPKPQLQPVGPMATQDSREPLRAVGHPGASARQQPQQRPMAPPQQPQLGPSAASSAHKQLQSGAFHWPETIGDQTRPVENETFVYVHGMRYQKLDLAGKGGSSKVFKVLGMNRAIYALKRVRFHNKDPEAVRGFIDEIALLRQLRSRPNIIQLIDAQVFREEGLVYMVLEYGDIDLSRLLQQHEKARSGKQAAATDAEANVQNAAASEQAAGLDTPAEIDVNFIRLYWQQMLLAVRCIHELRIVHADLKPANFMLVQGQLKLIDFGIAKAIQGDTTSINRESQVGTLNYMSPEAIQGGASNPLGGPPLKVGRPSDVWSLGCILYQMIYGRTPFADLPFIPKMNAICNPNFEIPFPPCPEPDVVDAIKRCLDRNSKTRATLQELLDHNFLHPNRRKQSELAAQEAASSSTSAANGSSGLPLTQEQIRAILQIGVSGANGATDLDTLARKVMQQLAGGSAGLVTTTPAHGAAAGSGSATSSAHASAVAQAAAPRAPPPPPPGPPPPPPFKQPGAAPASAPPPPPPPPPLPPMLGLGVTPAAPGGTSTVAHSAQAPMLREHPASAMQAPAAMSDIAAMAAAAAAKRASRPLPDPDQLRAAAAAVQRPAPLLRPPAGGVAGLPLGGAELHAAILQQRNQLRSVAEQQQHQQPIAPSAALGALQGGAAANGSSAAATASGVAGNESALEAVLRKGLERFHFDDPASETHGNTEFIEAAMARKP